MKKIFIAAGLLLIGATAAAAQENKAVEQALLKVKQNELDAFNRHDKNAVLALLADGYFEIEPSGAFDRQTIAGRAANNPADMKIADDMKDVHVTVVGDTAVMTYRSDVTLTQGKMVHAMSPRHVMDVFARVSDKWMMVATYSTDLTAGGKPVKKGS